MTRLPATTIQRTVAIVAVVLITTALCVISWFAGSPLLSRIRDIDLEDELRNLQGPSARSIIKWP